MWISADLFRRYFILLYMEQTTDTLTQKKTWNPVIITANTALSGTRLKNFYLTHTLQGFVWMIFHFSVVYFFTFQLESVALVGIFLWFANLISFFVDIPIGILQRHYSTKKLFTIAAIWQLLATGIFFLFIYNAFSAIGWVGKIIVPSGFESTISWFFGNGINWILLIVASICYGIVKEINDVSTYAYMLSRANPSEYARVLARGNITYWLGSLAGLLLSGIILAINPTFAVMVLGVIIGGLLFFTVRFFDNAEESIEAKDIVSFTVAVKHLNAENVTEYITEKIQAVDLPQIMQNTKYIFLKPKKISGEKIDWKGILRETKIAGRVIIDVLISKPVHLILYWTISLVLIFWFWDTFATTFLIDFLDNKLHHWWYVILAIIAIPALWLQELASNLAEKIGFKLVAYFWLFISGASLLLLWVVSEAHISIIVILAVINSIGYACGMALGQKEFLESYNEIYAEKMALTEIDANASAGPIKILQNLANVVGLICGGFILGVFGYAGFFILFGILILTVLAWSIKNRGEIAI